MHVFVCIVCYGARMETRNATFRLPVELLSRAKQVAAQRNISVNTLVREALTRETSGGKEYQAAMDRQLKLMDAGLELRTEGEEYASRDSLYERTS